MIGSMTIELWLETAIQDAERRRVQGLRPLLEGLARSTATLRAADWNVDMTRELDAPRISNAR